MTRQRGSILLHVLVAAAFLAVFGIVWASAYKAASTHTERGVDRARARAIAEAAWTRARLALEQGDDPSGAKQLLGAQTLVKIEPWHGGQRITVVARVVHLPERDFVSCELIVDFAIVERHVVVRARREVSA